MSVSDPHLFVITVRMKRYYDELSFSTVDAPDAFVLCVKVLKYILRCQMSDPVLYHKATSDIEITSVIETARKNFGRLFKQCDLLPVPALGIV